MAPILCVLRSIFVPNTNTLRGIQIEVSVIGLPAIVRTLRQPPRAESKGILVIVLITLLVDTTLAGCLARRRRPCQKRVRLALRRQPRPQPPRLQV